MIRRQRWNPQFWKRDALARLKEHGCPVCMNHLKGVTRDFFWFVNETYYEVETIVDMRCSYGFCPTHTRHLLATGASSQITVVFSYLTDYVLGRLQEAQALLDHSKDGKNSRDRCRRAAEVLRPRSVCRTCRALKWWEDHNISIVLETLPDVEVKETYEKSTGLCLPHFRKAALSVKADWDSLSFLTRNMRERLMTLRIPKRPPALLLDQVRGMDQERFLRRNPKKAEPSDASSRGKGPRVFSKSWSPTFEEGLVLLAEPGCPVCRCCRRGLEIYLNWLAQEMDAVASPSVYWDPSWNVCPTHFWEWASAHERAAFLSAEHTALEWLRKLEDLAVGLADRPPDRLVDRFARVPAAWGQRLSGPRGRAAGLWSTLIRTLESPDHKVDRLREPPFREDQCQACWHIRETTRRTIDLILRVVEEPAGRQAYHQGWGLCLRHCITAAGMAENAATLSELLKAQIIRLRLLQWELAEASRKMNWSVRYEPRGPEESAWRRAAYQFCGV